MTTLDGKHRGHSRPIDLLGVGVDSLSVPELHQRIDDLIRRQGHGLVLNVNVHCLNLCYENPWLRDFLNGAEVVFCDGQGVRLGAWLTGQFLAARITYADWLPRLAAHLTERGHSLFLLGGEPGVADEAAECLLEANPDLDLCGTHHGWFEKSPGSRENEAVLELVNAASPEVLLVAFGMPLQERWLSENWDRLEARVGLTGGAALDYVSGRVPRGSPLLVENGFEWLARLLHDPVRLWRRYLLGNPLFLWRLLASRFGHGA